jgi:hypothetical protein
MTLRPSNPRAKPRWALLAVGVAALLLAVVGVALAVHDDGLFELDKNVQDDTNVTQVGFLGSQVIANATVIDVCRTAAATPADGSILLIEAERMTKTGPAAGTFGGNCPGTKERYAVTRTTPTVKHAASGVEGYVSLVQEAVDKAGTDWNKVFQAAGPGGVDPKCLALGLVECTFVEDGIGPTTFIGGGSKDHLPISGWQESAGASPDKGEILNAYAAKGLSTEDGNQILYFGMDRYAVDGSTDIGFWFFKNEVKLNGSGGFTGEHAIGDILILGTFTQGGATSNIRVFRWVGTGGNESGTIQGPDGTFADCVPGGANDPGCATVNDTSIEVPWGIASKGAAASGWRPAGGVFEGGIDLTASGLEGCYSSFLAETRSSPEITAILKDFALGSFEACGSSLTTTPANGAGTALTDTDDPANGLPDIGIGTGSVQVKDLANLSITGISSWQGSLKFFLCGPIASGTCDVGGTQIGGTTAVYKGISGQTETVFPVASAAATVTSVGRYCWRGEFTSGTNGVPNSTDSSLTECFEVKPAQPAISTNATAGPIVIGGSISDSATLTGTASKPGTPAINPSTAGGAATGTITFRVYGPNDATCTNTPVHTATASVSGDGSYSSGSFTPTSAGTYRWVASYDGDSPNTLSVSGACNDANETSVVSPRQPTISTNATAGPVTLGSPISDSATLANTSPKPDGSPAGGTITFYLYGPDNATCSGTPVTVAAVNVSGDNTYSSGDYTPTAAGTYRWIAVYSGDSPNTLGVSGSCNDPNESSVVITLQPSMTTAQSFIPNDSATITVAAGGGNLAGSVRFRLYENSTCTGTAVYDQTVAVSGASPQTVGTSNTGGASGYVVNATKTLSWLVEYTSTNTAHNNVTKACHSENTVLTISNGSASTTP